MYRQNRPTILAATAAITVASESTTPRFGQNKEFSMKITRIHLFVEAAWILLLSVSGFCQAPSTISCTPGSGEWDVLSVMMMQPSLTQANKHVQGTAYNYTIKPTSTQPSYLYTNWTVTNQTLNQGQVTYVKTYQYLPGQTSTLYGYPWDINNYDDSYIYLWITELNWGDPWSFKPFSESTVQLAPRCAVPGSSSAIQWMDSTQSTFTLHPNPTPSSNYEYNSTDCTERSTTENLGWVQTSVGTTISGQFTLTDQTNNNNQIPLTLLPVTYLYNCQSKNADNCGSKEEFDYGIDSSKNSYGWVQWTLWSDTTYQSNFGSPAQKTVNNVLAADDLSVGDNGSVYFPCTNP
jgi:hypothetical protein